jgi:tellurite resistance protein TerC
MSSLDVPAWAWALLAGLLITCLVIDLTAHRGDRVDSGRRSLVWSAIWVGAALAFNAFVALVFGWPAGEQFLAAYLLEKSLSVDNLFLFLVVFGTLRIPPTEQRRVLTWGIFGALLSRAAFMVAGVAALARWHELTYVLGAVLVVAAIRLARSDDSHEPPRALRWIQRHLPWTPKLDGHRFFTRGEGRWVATPLLVALIAIEVADLVFALDSIPAAFAVTDEPFILYSSNVFAVLGLRALFVVLASALQNVRYLKYGLVAVLGFAGAKLLVAPWIHVPPLVSVAVIAACIGGAVVASVLAERRGRRSAHDLPGLHGGVHSG